jgi:hypothetical protein
LIPASMRPRPVGRAAADPRRECALQGRAGMLSVEFTRITGGDLRSGAERMFDSRVEHYEARAVPDLGDAAAVATPGVATIIVLVRRGNVVVMVTYFPGSDPPALPDGGRADCIAVARLALDAIQVE